GLVPGVAVVGAAPQVGHGVDPAILEPLDESRRERGRHTDAEAAVAVEDRRGVACGPQALAVRDEHRDGRAVLRDVLHLLDLDVVRLYGRLGPLPELERALGITNVEAVDAVRVAKAREGYER